jgi:NADH-quinone oxidoreductase subunit N
VAYFITTLAAFGVVTILSDGDRDADNMDDYRGLAYQRPWLAALFTAVLLSLAGIPLTAGFVGKFLLVTAGVGSALWLLVIVLVVTSAIGLFYYLRIVITMYTRPTQAVEIHLPSSISLLGGLALAVLGVLLIWLGVYPGPLIQIIQAMAASLY